MITASIVRINGHKLSLVPRRGTYEAMPGDSTLCFIATILEEEWGLKGVDAVDARTMLVREKVRKLASPFALRYIHLLDYAIPGLDFSASIADASMPPGAEATMLVTMAAGFVVSSMKKQKRVFVCDNAHSLDFHSWMALRGMFNSSEKNMML